MGNPVKAVYKRNKSEDLPCSFSIIAFEERALNLMIIFILFSFRFEGYSCFKILLLQYLTLSDIKTRK